MPTYVYENDQKIYQKLYEDRNYLVTEFLTLGRTAKQIASDNNVSYKLVNTWLVKYGIVPSGKVNTV
jgi:transposase